MKPSDIKEYIDHTKSIINQSPQMNEENTKFKVVQPLIKHLGWDIYSSVELEYPIQMGSRQKKVDYALLLDEVPLVFIEVKGAGSAISESDIKQLKSYMRQDGVDWGILTNGKKFHFFKRKKEISRPDEVSLGEFRLDDLKNNIETLEIFSKEKIESGESEKIAENIEAVQEAVSKLKNKKEEIAEQVQKTITDEIEEVSTRKIEEESKEFVTKLISSLETQTPIKPLSETKEEESEDYEGSSWEPKKGRNAVSGKISRKDIKGNPESLVAVFPSHESGIRFLKENNAWGFVRLGREPKYACIYLTNEKRVKYFAEVEKIVPANKAKLARSPESYVDKARFDPNKKVIFFKPGKLRKLEDPIPYKEKAPQGRVYTTLKKFKESKSTKGLF